MGEEELKLWQFNKSSPQQMVDELDARAYKNVTNDEAVHRYARAMSASKRKRKTLGFHLTENQKTTIIAALIGITVLGTAALFWTTTIERTDARYGPPPASYEEGGRTFGG